MNIKALVTRDVYEGRVMEYGTPNVMEDQEQKLTTSYRLIHFVDFVCPLSGRSFYTIQTLLQEYKNQIQLEVKHLPHQRHPNAMLCAQFYEALYLQNKELVNDYYDQLFMSQENLRRGESLLYDMALALGADRHQLEIDLYSQEVQKKIDQDQQTARYYGIGSTPAFVLNGVVMTGAYSLDHFRALIEKLEGQSFFEH